MSFDEWAVVGVTLLIDELLGSLDGPVPVIALDRVQGQSVMVRLVASVTV